MRFGLSVLALTALAFTQPASAYTLTNIFGFSGGSDGGCPSGPLHKDANGNLFVTLGCGGLYNHGAVARIEPPKPGLTQWTETVMASFNNYTVGGSPSGGVTPDGHGGYWLTNLTGGNGAGTVVDMRPPVPPFNPNWRAAVRWRFKMTGGDGKGPTGGLTAGPADAVYGTTFGGGTNNHGTVFKLAPPRTGNLDTETIIWKFTGGKDGSSPFAPPIGDGSGGLYGTTAGGGAHGYGTIWHLTPPTSGTGHWTLTVLYDFTGGLDDGASPEGALLLNGGNLYGVCEGGIGIPGQHGSVWQLAAPSGGGTTWTFHKMWQYDGGTDGAEPMTGIMRYKNTFYSSAYYGGGGPGAGYGTMISLVPTSKTTWTQTTVVNYNQGNGAYPGGPLLPSGTAGTFYGTTVGGILNYGQVFQFTP